MTAIVFAGGSIRVPFDGVVQVIGSQSPQLVYSVISVCYFEPLGYYTSFLRLFTSPSSSHDCTVMFSIFLTIAKALGSKRINLGVSLFRTGSRQKNDNE